MTSKSDVSSARGAERGNDETRRSSRCRCTREEHAEPRLPRRGRGHRGIRNFIARYRGVGKGAPVCCLEAFGRASPAESGLYHAPAPPRREPRAQGRIRARAPERRGDRLGASRSGTTSPVFSCSTTVPIPPGRRGDHRRARGQRLRERCSAGRPRCPLSSWTDGTTPRYRRPQGAAATSS